MSGEGKRFKKKGRGGVKAREKMKERKNPMAGDHTTYNPTE